MLPRYSFQKKSKKDLISLILQIHFLVFCLIVVLWGRSYFKKKLHTPNQQILERKAQFITPSKTNRTSEKPKNKER